MSGTGRIGKGLKKEHSGEGSRGWNDCLNVEEEWDGENVTLCGTFCGEEGAVLTDGGISTERTFFAPDS
jgi:hypothetical protein